MAVNAVAFIASLVTILFSVHHVMAFLKGQSMGNHSLSANDRTEIRPELTVKLGTLTE